ncbi:hypothetical protein [Candidatus Vidania fulgoroideorum]
MKIKSKSNIIRIYNKTILTNTTIAEILKKRLKLKGIKYIRGNSIIEILIEVEKNRNILFFTNIKGTILRKTIVPLILEKNNIFLFLPVRDNYDISLSNSNIIKFLGYKNNIKKEYIEKELYILNISKGITIRKSIKDTIIEHRKKKKEKDNKILRYLKLKYIFKLNA